MRDAGAGPPSVARDVSTSYGLTTPPRVAIKTGSKQALFSGDADLPHLEGLYDLRGCSERSVMSREEAREDRLWETPAVQETKHAHNREKPLVSPV